MYYAMPDDEEEDVGPPLSGGRATDAIRSSVGVSGKGPLLQKLKYGHREAVE